MPVQYITVTPLTNMFKPATRSYGDIGIVGATDGTGTDPTVPTSFTNPNDVTFGGDLADAVKVAFRQTPGPMKVWAMKADTSDTSTGGSLATGLAALEDISVQIVVLANTPLTASAGSNAITMLAEHVDSVSKYGGDGKERIGIAMLGKGVAWALASDANIPVPALIDRMVMVAHKSDEDAAAAYAGAIAGYEPHISLLLKPVSIDMTEQFSSSQIDVFEETKVNWLTDPDLFPGKGIFAGEGFTLDSTKEKIYIDIIRTIDDISFSLKARLIRTIGNLRVSRSGLRALSSEMAAVLEPYKQRGVIEAYDIFLPLLILLDKDPNALTDLELQLINDAQNTREVEATVTVDYAGAIHRLQITLKFE